ncbi:hypothetical protein JOQ06_030079 [Pogonophryne albipinna]|uniref:Uncharacterized protein n=1 Tax=Pogonophryne albipinna TaxID=1090488 RepID=A0AAD6AY92_9TELE|nr:hypothetical protein JOQ06_030079 [Pogonophryne albipinna]
MEQLAQTAPEVYQGFLDGDFVAKETKHSFNDVPFDLRLEHINKTEKEDTRSLFGLTHDDDDDEETHKDCLQSRIKRDNHDFIQLVDQFQRYNVFQQEHMYDFVSLTTGDVASEEILNDLTHAAESGKKTITELSTSNSIQEVRCTLFRKLKANVDTLPPTEDALSMHLKRAHYQTKVWKQSLVTHPQLPSPINCGWQMMNAWCMNSNDIQETNGEETDLDLDVVVRPPEKSTSTTRSSVCDAQPSTSARVLRAQGRTDRRL